MENWQYYDDGRLKSIQNPNYQESYQYTATGALDLVTNSTLNQTIDYSTDANSRRIGMTTANQRVVYQRDSLGRIEKLFDGEEEYSFGYDANGRLVSKTSPNGTRDLTLYNERGETIAVVLQRAQTEADIAEQGYLYGFDDRFVYNYQRSSNVPMSADLYAFEAHLSEVAAQLAAQFPESGFVTEDLLVYQWNAAGNLVAKQYNDKFSFFYEYDNADRLTKAFEPEGLVTQYVWDANGNLETKTVRDLVYGYEYNEANQLTASTTWRLEHTGNGNSKGNSGKNAHQNSGTQEDWDQHHEDQSHYFEYLWDTKVNLWQTQQRTTHDYDANGNLQTETTRGAGGVEVKTYHHDVYDRLTGIDTPYGAQVRFDYDSRDRRIRSAQSGWTDLVNADEHKTSADYSYTSLYDGRQELSQYNQENGEQALYRQLTYLPNQVAGLYGQLLKQTLPQWQNAEFDVTGWGEDLAPELYFHSDYQNSTVKVTGADASAQYRYGYTPMGQAYGFKHRYSDEQMTRSFSSHSPNRNVVQNLYTGKYAEPLTGLAQMDARWYDAQKGRFIQGDQYNHANLMLPKGAQSELMRYIGRSQGDLLRDPAQQMRYGYVSGNPLTFADSTGLYFGIDNVVGAVAGAVAGAVGGFISSDEGFLNTTVGVVAGAVTGAAVGAVVVIPAAAGSAGAAAGAAASGALGSLAGQFAGNAVSGNDVLDIDNYSAGAVLGGAVGGGIGSLVGKGTSSFFATPIIGSRLPNPVTTYPQAIAGAIPEGIGSGAGELTGNKVERIIGCL